MDIIKKIVGFNVCELIIKFAEHSIYNIKIYKKKLLEPLIIPAEFICFDHKTYLSENRDYSFCDYYDENGPKEYLIEPFSKKHRYLYPFQQSKKYTAYIFKIPCPKCGFKDSCCELRIFYTNKMTYNNFTEFSFMHDCCIPNQEYNVIIL